MKIWIISLILLLGLQTSTVYAGSPTFNLSIKDLNQKKNTITVQISLKNSGTEPLVISKESVFYQVSFTKDAKRSEYSSGSSDEVLSATGGLAKESDTDFLTLGPKKAYVVKRTFSLKDEFFCASRDYSLHLTYGYFRKSTYENLPVWLGYVSSNRVNFTLN